MKIEITIEGVTNPFVGIRKHMNVWFDSRTRNVMVKVLYVAVLMFTCFIACRALYFYGYPVASLVLSITCIGVALYKYFKMVLSALSADKGTVSPTEDKYNAAPDNDKAWNEL